MSAPATAAAVRTRPARAGDAPGVAALIDAVAAEGWLGLDAAGAVAAERQRLQLAGARPLDVGVWVAEAVEGIVGHLAVTRYPFPACAHVGDVAVAVARFARGRGVAGDLLRGAMDWAAAVGLTKLSASVLGHNAPALRLFGGHGFRREGLRRGQFVLGGVCRDEVVLARFLEPTPLAAARRDGGR